jgi:hypothetical protein
MRGHSQPVTTKKQKKHMKKETNMQLRKLINTRVQKLGLTVLLGGAVLCSVQNLLADDDDDASSFSGEAIGIWLNNLPQPTPSPVVVADAGPLPSFGGKGDASADHVNLYDGAVTCDHADSHIEGKDDHSDSHSHVSHVHLQFMGSDGSVNTLDADNVDTHVKVQCKHDKEDEDADEAGDEDKDFHHEIHVNVQGLVVNGVKIQTHPDTRQVIDYPGFTLIVNDASDSDSDDFEEAAATGITVVVSGNVEAEVGKAEANVVCEEEGESDEVTGGGTFTAGNGDTDTFSFSGGANGQLMFSDTGAGVNVVSIGAPVVTQIDATTEQLVYACLINGVVGTATCVVQDLGAFGAGDTFSISLSTGFSANGMLTSGDIVLLN